MVWRGDAGVSSSLTEAMIEDHERNIAQSQAWLETLCERLQKLAWEAAMEYERELLEKKGEPADG